MTSRLPVLFVGHGSPANALGDNPWRSALARVGKDLPRPRAIVCVSAHWLTRGTWITAASTQRAIHDFGGFDEALYRLRYEPPGDPDLARDLAARLADFGAQTAADRGLDHGAWTALMPMFPDADVPTVQLSIDRAADAAGCLRIGAALASLRDEGVLLVGSGNVTHNLAHAFASMQRGDPAVPAWAARFDEAVAQALRERDTAALAALWPSADGLLAHPTPDHFWPLLYAYGASDERDDCAFVVEGFDLGSLSMRSARFG